MAFACSVCDAEIVITPPLADCFLERVESEIETMKASGLSYQLVVLGSCSEAADGALRSANTQGDSSRKMFPLTEIKNAGPETPSEPSKAFILDERGLRCLEDFLLRDPTAFDPAAAFRRSEMCDN